MQDTPASATRPAASHLSPTHEEIADCARDLWVSYGKPADRDLAIWLEAEQKLLAPAAAPREKFALAAAALTPPPVKPAPAFDRHRIHASTPAVRAADRPERP